MITERIGLHSVLLPSLIIDDIGLIAWNKHVNDDDDDDDEEDWYGANST